MDAAPPGAQNDPAHPVPQCAHRPAPATSRSVGFWLGVGVFLFPVVFVWFLLRQGHSTTSRVIGFAWLALMVVAMASGDRPASTSSATSSKQSQPAKVEAPAEPLFAVSAQQLAQAYDRNTVAADQQFKGKRFKVTGVVDSINTDMFGNPYVTLRGGVNQFMEPQFELDDAPCQLRCRAAEQHAHQPDLHR